MTKQTLSKLLRFAALAVVVAAIISGYPQKLFRQATPLKAAGDRPRMPQMDLPLVGGGSWSLDRHKGKVVVVNFWATWCPPCREETPELVNLHRRYADKSVAMVGISMDDEPSEVVPGFMSQYRMTYPVAFPTPDFHLAREVESLPTTLLLDKQGRVAKSFIGAVDESDLAPAIDQLLSE